VFRFALALLITILWLAGCATRHFDRPEIAGLHRVTTPRSIVLNDPLYWRVDWTDGDMGLAPGVYTADEDNPAGTFFQGPKFAYFWSLHDRDGSSIECRSNAGIWVPKNGGPARVWVDFDHGDRTKTLPLGRRSSPAPLSQLVAQRAQSLIHLRKTPWPSDPNSAHKESPLANFPQLAQE
jgi:hypothetical protein